MNRDGVDYYRADMSLSSFFPNWYLGGLERTLKTPEQFDEPAPRTMPKGGYWHRPDHIAVLAVALARLSFNCGLGYPPTSCTNKITTTIPAKPVAVNSSHFGLTARRGFLSICSIKSSVWKTNGIRIAQTLRVSVLRSGIEPNNESER